MKISPVNNISFGKTFISTVNVRKTDEGDKFEKAKLVEYDPDDANDKSEINSIKKAWGKAARLMPQIVSGFDFGQSRTFFQLEDGCFVEKNDDRIKRRFLALETGGGDALAIAHTTELKGEDDIEIATLQTNPKQMYGSDTREYRKLGAKLVSEIIKIAKNEGKETVLALSDNDDFWYSSGLFKLEEGSEDLMYLDYGDFDKYIEYADA